MTVTLSGDNILGIDDSLHSMLQAFIESEGDLSVERLDAENIDSNRLSEAIQSVPLLSNKKLVVLQSPSKNKKISNDIEHILSEIPVSTEVIVVDPKPDKRSSLYKYLRSKTDFRNFDQLDGNKLVQWVMQLAKQDGGTISNSDAAFLIDRVGQNQLRLKNEVQKLALFDTKISRASIVELTEQSPQSTIFELLESAFAGNSTKVFSIYDELRELRIDTAQIISMLTWQLHIIALLKSAGSRSSDQIASSSKVSPYVIRKNSAIVRHVDMVTVKKLISELLELDLMIKRTGVDADEAIQAYLLRLASAFASK